VAREHSDRGSAECREAAPRHARLFFFNSELVVSLVFHGLNKEDETGVLPDLGPTAGPGLVDPGAVPAATFYPCRSGKATRLVLEAAKGGCLSGCRLVVLIVNVAFVMRLPSLGPAS